MVKKRERLEVIFDILKVIRQNNNLIRPTKLLFASNLSPQMFKEYKKELIEKELIEQNNDKNKKTTFSLTKKGYEFLEKYTIVQDFIENFGL